MASSVPVSRERHAGKVWRQPTNYAFAATEAVVSLAGLEFAKAAVSLPIAFIQQSGGYTPVAVMSPFEGRNLFIAPSGQWLGSYVPAALRCYPFGLARVKGSDR
jgi:hypothetical protein